MLALACLLVGRGVAVHAAGLPTLTSITVDGDLGDWVAVLANPSNVTLDGDGSTLACADSDDADCPVPSDQRDLRRFAWTMDDQALFLLIERQTTDQWYENFLVYLDLDFDGLMESDEPVIEWIKDDAGTRDRVRSNIYVPADPAGDPLVDGASRADGYTLPGTTTLGVILDDVGPSTPDGRIREIAVPWTSLGVPPGSPLGFHVASSQDGDVPLDVSDNLGGPDGGAGLTAYGALALDAGVETGVAPGSTLRLAHAFANTGNVPTTILAVVTSSCGHALELFLDLDGDGTDDVSLGRDAEGDGDFSSALDDLYAAGDSDADGRLDLGAWAPDDGATLAVELTAGASGGCEVDHLRIELARVEDAQATASALDLVHLGELTLSPREQELAVAAGEVAWLPHRVRYQGATPLEVELTCLDTFAWGCSVLLDANGDGLPADAAALPDADGDGSPELDL